MSSSDIKQPMPKEGFNINYICRYESEIDRAIILDSMGHYIEEVLGSKEILFVKVPMEAINKAFKPNPKFPGEEIEFTIDHKKNNIVKCTELVGDELPSLWSVMSNEENDLHIITTIEPCKFILKKDDLSKFEELMSHVEIAPKEYDYDALNMVHWNETTMSLKRDIEFFVTGKKFFDSRDMAWSRSYLLHGPPGNGKTTTIKAIARFLNARVETFDFSAAMQSPDKQFQSWVLGESERIAREEDDYDEDYDDDDDEAEYNTVPIRLLVFEDIDRLFPKDGSKQTAVSLQAVLQALDGAIERRNMIVVATANHPKELDQQVLARPGRFDKQVFYEQPSLDEAFVYLKKLFDGEDVRDETISDCCKRLSGHSYAFHKELFATAASYAIERMSSVVNDDDVKNGINDLVKHIDDVIMKSVKPTFGFSQ
jgi:SpoVK/Ycf46/Vps4 family AAA+-type ATPase